MDEQATFEIRAVLASRRHRGQHRGLVIGSIAPVTLARIDPGAAHQAVTAAPTANRIWYRRVLGSDPAIDPLRWVAIDDATGELIASGAVGG